MRETIKRETVGKPRRQIQPDQPIPATFLDVRQIAQNNPDRESASLTRRAQSFYSPKQQIDPDQPNLRKKM
jgi:hypothetical protein